MSALVEEVVRQALDLKEEERAEVAARILDSLETKGTGVADAAWEAEIERRGAEMEAGAVAGVSWEDLALRLRFSQTSS